MLKQIRLIIIMSLFINSLFVTSNGYAGEVELIVNSQEEMEGVIYNTIKNRESSIKVRYNGDTSDIIPKIKAARNHAVTRDPYEEGCISLISGFKVNVNDNYADIIFDSFKYFTTKEQEAYVDQEIKNRTKMIVTNDMDENTKMKAIHDYIISNIKYDDTKSAYTAYSALHDGITVCNGYTQLLYRMLKEAGIDVKIVRGFLKIQDNLQNHAWNMAKINNEWYHFDITLDRTLSANSKSINYTYYKLTDSDIENSHIYDNTSYPTSNYKNNNVSQVSIKSSGGSNITSTVEKTNNLLTPSILENSEEIDTFKSIPVESQKVWTVQFTKPISFNTVNSNSIFVVNEAGDSVEGLRFEQGDKDNILFIHPPKDGYEPGATYTLYILSTVQSEKEKVLEKNVVFPFIVRQ